MSYDLTVSFKSWPADAQERWVAEMHRLGITVEVDADAFTSGTGWLPMKLTIESGAIIPWADEFRARGTFESGFERSKTAKQVAFTAKSNEGNACAVWSAAALAAVTTGKLTDPQASVIAKGTRAIDIIATLMKNESFVGAFHGPEEMGDLPAITFEAPRPEKKPAPELEIEIDDSKPISDYSASVMFAVGDQVKHPSFGTGLVEATDVGKVTIAFRSGRRVLAQSKTSNNLARPNRIDHSLPTPGSKPNK
ncbi:MAG TPA: hypothetical protein VGM39_01450 [Kofleriaceae bacterium]